MPEYDFLSTSYFSSFFNSLLYLSFWNSSPYILCWSYSPGFLIAFVSLLFLGVSVKRKWQSSLVISAFESDLHITLPLDCVTLTNLLSLLNPQFLHEKNRDVLYTFCGRILTEHFSPIVPVPITPSEFTSASWILFWTCNTLLHCTKYYHVYVPAIS